MSQVKMDIDFEVFKANKECFYFRLNHMFFSFIPPNVMAISQDDKGISGRICFNDTVSSFMDRFELAYAISKYASFKLGISESLDRYDEEGLDPCEKEALELLIQDNVELMRNDEFIEVHLKPNGGNENE